MSNPDDIEEWIRDKDSGECIEDQVHTGYWFHENDVTEPADRWKRTSELEEKLDSTLTHTTKTVIDNLVKIEVLKVVKGGDSKYIRNHRTETNFYSPNESGFVESITEEITRFLLDIRDQERAQQPVVADGGDEDNPTIREVAAEPLQGPPNELVAELTGTLEFIDDIPGQASEDELHLDDPVERMNKFDTAVQAVIENEDVQRGREYDQMGFRNESNKYTLSQRAKAIEDNHSVSDF